jgi:hypothetical protein
MSTLISLDLAQTRARFLRSLSPMVLLHSDEYSIDVSTTLSGVDSLVLHSEHVLLTAGNDEHP